MGAVITKAAAADLPAVAQILDETEDRATVCYRPTK